MQNLSKNGTSLYKEYYLEIEDCKDKNQDINNTGSNLFFYKKCIKNLDIFLTGSWSDINLVKLGLNVIKCKNETNILKEYTNIKNQKEMDILEDYQKKLKYKLSPSEYINNEYNEYYNYTNFYEYLKNYPKGENKIVCKTPEEIEKKLSEEIFLGIVYDKVFENPGDFNKPFSYFTEIDWVELIEGVNKNKQYFFDNYSIRTDAGIIFSDVKEDGKRWAIDTITFDFNIYKKTENLVNLDFYVTRKINISQRHYIKLTEIFAKLGGFIGLTMLFFRLVSFPYFNSKLKSLIINKYFNLNEDSKNKNVIKYLTIKIIFNINQYFYIIFIYF